MRRWRCTVEWVSRLIALDTLRVRFNKKTWYCLTLFTPWYSHDFHLICLLFTTRQMHSRKFKFIDNFALVVDCLRLFLQKAPIYISSRVESNTWDRSRVINIFFFSFFPLKLFHTLFQHQKVLFSCFFRKNNMRKRLETGRKIKQKLNSNVGRTNSTREWTSVGCRKLCIVKIEIFIYEFRPMLYPFLYSSHSTQLLLVLFMMSKYINFRHPACLKNIKATQK